MSSDREKVVLVVITSSVFTTIMTLQVRTDQKKLVEKDKLHSPFHEGVFSKDYVDFLNEAGWRLEKKLPSNSNHYSDLLEDTDWKYNNTDLKCSILYRRDLDGLS